MGILRLHTDAGRALKTVASILPVDARSGDGAVRVFSFMTDVTVL